MEKAKQYVDVTQTQELPSMHLKITKASSDFVTSHIEVSCSGFNIDQCKKGISFLLNSINEIENRSMKQGNQVIK